MGDGPEMPALRQQAEELGISESVTFTGTYIRSDFAAELLKSDCFVLPSRSETFGIVYAEALATGTPVIATKCGGPEDFVDDTNGLLVPVDDVSALADAMKQMMTEADRYDPKSMAEECNRRFSSEVIGRELSGIMISGSNA